MHRIRVRLCSAPRVSTTDSLPHDVESLRALALKAIAERDVAIAERDAERIEKAKLVAEYDRLQSLYEHVHHLLRKANDHRFGARNERLERLPADQLQLALEDIEASLAKTEATEEKKEPRLPRTGTRKRGALPNNLPRIHETVAPPTVCNALRSGLRDQSTRSSGSPCLKTCGWPAATRHNRRLGHARL